MAPPKKREASSVVTTDKNSKRLKEEPDTKEDAEKRDNNNVTNGSIKESEVKTDNKTPMKIDPGKEVKGEKKAEKDVKKEDEVVNGAKVKVGDSKQSETNGNKSEEKGDKKEKEEKEEEKSKKAKEEPVKTEAEEENDAESETEPKESTGTLLICGGANWDMTGRKELPKTAKKPVNIDPGARNLWGPHRVRLESADKDLRVKGVFSGCNACHSVVVTEDGLAMTFGRNDKGQLGLGDTETRTTPVVVEALKGIDIVAAACGRSHTLFLSSDGMVFGCGDNKMGQCGTNQQSVHTITTPARIAFKENKPVVRVACGAEFSMIIDIEGRLYSFGHPEHGQLGHNSEGKYFTTGNKYAFHCEYQPRRIVTYIEKSREGHVSPIPDIYITDVACGTNHTLAVDKKGRCFSWGFAGYHRLGHCETKNELVPRSVKVFDAPNNSDRGVTKVYAGATYSMGLDVNGLLYFWGQNKSSGEATMYPKNVQDLCGWRIKALSCANRSIFVIADDICISWGPSPTYGELGYGEGKSKSSTVPQEVKTLDGINVFDVACGFGHTLLIARDETPEDRAALNGKLKSWP